MTRFAGLPFVVIDDGTLPADTVPRLLPFATSVAVISSTPTSDLADQFVEAGVPATVHARGGALLHHAAVQSVRRRGTVRILRDGRPAGRMPRTHRMTPRHRKPPNRRIPQRRPTPPPTRSTQQANPTPAIPAASAMPSNSPRRTR